MNYSPGEQLANAERFLDWIDAHVSRLLKSRANISVVGNYKDTSLRVLSRKVDFKTMDYVRHTMLKLVFVRYNPESLYELEDLVNSIETIDLIRDSQIYLGYLESVSENVISLIYKSAIHLLTSKNFYNDNESLHSVD